MGGGRDGEPTGVDGAEFLLWVRDVRGLRVASVVSHLSALSWFFSIAGGHNPTKTVEVKATIKGGTGPAAAAVQGHPQTPQEGTGQTRVMRYYA